MQRATLQSSTGSRTTGLRAACVTTLCALLLAACESPSPRPPAVVESRRPTAVLAPQAPPAPVSYVDQLLADAADAIDRLHLTTPPGDNAWERYLQILELEPDNEAAAVGLQRIVDRYLDLADDALTAGDSARASRFLGRAAQVLPGHAGIAHMRVRLASLEHARTNSIALDATGVREQHPAVSEQLLAIGTRAKQAGQRIVITARSDREGRWLYQRLNAAPGPRLRSELRIGRAPALTLQQLPR